MRRGRQSVVEVVLELTATSVEAERWLATGWRDSRLSAAGKRQAVELRERRADEEIEAVFCSDLAQAAETARIAFGGSGLPLLHDWRLRDCDYGDLAGGPVAGVEQERVEHVYEPFPHGESYADVVVRSRSFLRDLGSRCAGGRVVVVAHPATKLAFDHVLEGTPLPELVAAPFRAQPGWVYSLAVDA